MIIASIDIMDGRAVQLVGGRDKALDAGDPRPLMRRFARLGEVAVIDLDAALGRGSNVGLIEELCAMGPARVGGGIRDVATARAWLDRGARRIILGTAAQPEILRQLPRERVVAALDGVRGEVVVEGWRRHTGRRVEEQLESLAPFVGGFLVTAVEREGRLVGYPVASAQRLKACSGDAELTVAGGVTTADEIADLDRLGVDAQVGMAIYTSRLGLAEAFAAPMRSDRADGLWPTVVVDEAGVCLGLVYSSLQSLRIAVEEGRGVYHSRSRGLWRKGETSGATQELLRVEVDCDRDALRFVVRQAGPGFCHRGSPTCFGPSDDLGSWQRHVAARAEGIGSYTARLLDDPVLLRAKLLEEAGELAAADTPSEVTHEAADVMYFAAVAMLRRGVSFADVQRELHQRSQRVSRRGGEAKPRREVSR